MIGQPESNQVPLNNLNQHNNSYYSQENPDTLQQQQQYPGMQGGGYSQQMVQPTMQMNMPPGMTPLQIEQMNRANQLLQMGMLNQPDPDVLLTYYLDKSKLSYH